MNLRSAALGLLFPLALGAAEDEPKLTLQNLGMEAGETVPTGWSGKFGTCTVSRDTTVFHSGKASLCVDRSTQTDVKNACAHQMISVTPGLKLNLSGWVKTEGTAKVSYAAQFFDERFTTNDCYPVKTLEGVHDWQEVDAELTVPENATRLAIALYVEGQGKAWLDDVKLKAGGVKVVVAKSKADPKPSAAPAEIKLIPTTPVPGYFPDRPQAWRLFHESQARRAKQGGIDVVFLGDALTQGWTNAGRESWTKNFEPLNAVNFGIGGDQTGNVLWRLDNGLMDGLSPRLVVLMVGASNLWSGQNSSEEIVSGYRAIVEKLRSKVPSSQILVLGVLPIGPSLADVVRQRATEVNVLAAQLDGWNMVKFLNFGSKFLRRDGMLQEGLFLPDNLHLTAKGYEVFAKELTPVVMELLKPAAPAAEPVKAPPDLGPVGR